ncbi:MAG TPA: alpha-L-arabinofuranosidase C-terminal domain-containing protein, partial [Chitinophagaceae bacterium]|nr:alpha-L-arabinofuranosidase C-terminal domain-containing protein [Chitinophagaceae bacterium]
MIKKQSILWVWLFLSGVYGLMAQPVLDVRTDKPLAPISSSMWGIFFEDINFAADGGLYAELVKNRSFEFDQPMMGWKAEGVNGGKGTVLIQNQSNVSPNNPRYATVNVNASNGTFILRNEGFRGMGIKEGAQYNFSVIGRQTEGSVHLSIHLVGSNGNEIGNANLSPSSSSFQKLSASLTATATDAKAKLELHFTGTGKLDIDMISLFPADTWKGRPGGLRKDLVQMLEGLKPGFIRFPGGCIVEGKDLQNRYQWKKTVGPAEERKLIMNRWNVEFKAPRNAPDYFQSYGLGFYEYFLLSDDLGAEPLPILNCGMACQYNTGEVVPIGQLNPYIQDALDLIDFANAPTTNEWGKLRAEMGHPQPFNLKYLGIGNEQWGPQYFERYKEFVSVLKGKHPEIIIVTTAGPYSDGNDFNYAWNEFNKLNAELVDEHYYKSPEWFLKNANRYDNYDRKGPKVFAGEYAAHSKDSTAPESRNTWISALSEAAFMTGLERNADVVRLSSYAPLMAHVDAWQWRPDLIWFDNLNVAATPNYYVQKLFSNNKGTHVLSITGAGKPLIGQDSVYASAVVDSINKQV